MQEKVGPRALLGVLTPSSNTVLEPLTSAMLAEVPDVTAHFGRFRVREISMRQEALGQFDTAPILDAADLLADAQVNTIIWSGTSSGWRGFDTDQALCAEIEGRTGIAAGTSVLAMNEIFQITGVKRIALVTPYLDEIQEPIIANYRAAGFDCVAERHLGDRRNFNFSQYSEELISSLICEVAEARPDAIAVYCTNFRGARIAEELERKIGIPIYDSVSTAVWKGMRLAGAEPARIRKWGRLFREVA